MLRFGLILLLITNLYYSCSLGPISYWYLQWDLKSINDSTSIEIRLPYELIVSNAKDNDKVISDTTESDGYLTHLIVVSGTEDAFRDRNANLRTMIYFENTLVYDSIYTWENLDFNSGIFKDGQSGTVPNLSEKTLYLDIP